MSYADDFLKALGKDKKKFINIQNMTGVKAADEETEKFLKLMQWEDDDIAPVGNSSSGRTSAYSFLSNPFEAESLTEAEKLMGGITERKEAEKLAELINKSKEESSKSDDKLDFFQKGAFSDGYQFGDIVKTILGTTADAGVGIVKGISRTAEGLVDLVGYGVSGVANLVGADEFSKVAKKTAQKDLTGQLFGGIDNYLDDYSVLGRTSDSIAEGIGQIGTIIATAGLGSAAGLGSFGTTALTTGTMGLSSWGSGMTEAYKGGASDEEAVAFGFTKGVVDAGSELIFGGLGKTVKAVGLSKGISSLDDMFAKKLSSKIANQTTKNLVQFGVKASAEGLEEVFAGVGTAAAKKLTYMSEEDLGKLIADENLLEQFVVGTVTSGIAQSGIVPGMSEGSLKESIKTGKDFVTGMTQNEQKVVDKVFEDEIKQREESGEKLTNKDKNKLYDEVVEKMEKGQISTDTIEEVLGGDSYNAYKDTIDSENALVEQQKALEDEYKTLNEKENKTLAEEARIGELRKQFQDNKAKLDDTQRKANQNLLKAQLGKNVYELTKNDRLRESYFERVRANQKFEADLTQYEGRAKDVIQKVMDSGLADNTNATHEFWDMMSKMSSDLDTDITLATDEQILEMVKAEYEADGLEFDASKFDGQRIDGYVSKNGIVLNAKSKRALNFVVGHEITHKFEASPKHYKKLQELLFEYAKDEYESRFNERSGQYANKFKADEKYKAKVDKEITGDLVGDYIFNDKGFIDHLTKDRNVFMRVWDEVKYMAKIAKAGSEQAKLLEKAKREFERAYRGAQKNNTTDNSGVNLVTETTPNGKTNVSNTGGVMSREEYDLWRIEELNRLNPQINGAIKGEIVDGDYLDGTSTDGSDKMIGSHYGSTVRRTNGAKSGTFTHELLHTIDMLTGHNVRHYVEDLASGKGFDDYESLMSYLKSAREQGKIDGRTTDAEETAQMVLHAFYADRDGLRQAAPEFTSYLEEMGLDKYSHIAKNYDEYLAESEAKTGTQYSLSNENSISASDGKTVNTSFTPAEIQSIQSIGQKSINSFNSQDIAATEKFARRYWEELGMKSPFYRAWFGDWRVNDSTPVKVATRQGDTRGVQKNTDTGWDIQVSGKVFNETRVHTDSYNIAARKYLPYINDIVKNAVLLDSYGVDSSKPKSQNSLLMHSMYAVADIGNGLEVLKLYVEEINNPNTSNTTKRSYQLQNIENYRPIGKSSQNAASSISPMVGNGVTVADLFAYVKQLDKNFAPNDSSKIVNADGTPKVMYHGSPAQFTAFDISKAKSSGQYGKGFYFTDSTSHAGTYGNLYSVYLNIRNPLQSGGATVSRDQVRSYLEAVAENEDYSIENYGTYDVDAVLNTVMGKATSADAFKVINDINATAIGNMVEAAELFNSINGTAFDGIVAPTETVAFYPEQIKSATDNVGTFDKSNPDIRFSLSEAVEETKDLMALHNLQASELVKSLELGGLPMPSVAIIKAQQGHDQYGDVSLILPKETIDPKARATNKVYGGDAWTPTYPRIEYKPNAKAEKKISDKYYELASKVGYDAVRPLYSYVSELERQLNYAGGEAAMLKELYEDTKMMQVYLEDSGKGKVEPVIKETRTEATEAEKEMNQWFIDKLGEDVIRSFKAPAGVSPIAHRKAFMEQYGEQAEQAYRDLLVEKFDFEPEDVSNVLDNTDTKDLMRFLRDAAIYLNNGGVTIKTETDHKATDDAIRKASADGYKAWVDNLFGGVEEKSGIRNNQDYYTRSGNPRSWDALHWENTLENVVKTMKGQEETGTGSLSPYNSFASLAHKRYGSIEEIKADSDRLGKVSEEEYEALGDSFANRFSKIADSIKDPAERNPFIATDEAAELIVDAVRTHKTKAGMLSYLQKWNKRVTQQTVDDIASLVNDIANMPTGYFEAKPQRAVGFDEVAVFVIPRNADVKLKQELLNRGYNIAEYDPDVEGDRQKVVNQFEQYKFSLSDVGEQRKDTGGYQYYSHIPNASEDIAPIENNVQNVQESSMVDAPIAEAPVEAPVTEVTEETEMFPDDLAPMAEDDSDALDRLASLDDADAPPEIMPEYDEMADGIPLTQKTVADIAKNVKAALGLSNRQMVEVHNLIREYSAQEFPSREQLFEDVKERFGTYKETETDDVMVEVKKEIRTTPLLVSDTIKNDIADYGDFQRRHFGRVRFSKQGVPVDVVYEGLSTEYPYLFPANIINPTDQLLRIAEVSSEDATIENEQPIGDETIWSVANAIANGINEYKQTQRQKQSGKFARESFNSLMKNADDYAPVVEDDIAPVAVENAAPVVEEVNAEDIAPVEIAPTEEAVKPNAPVIDKPIKTVKERLAAKLQNFQTELANTQKLRGESNADYDSEIARLQEEYNSKKNKNTIGANNILLRIERLQRIKNNTDADYAKRISDLEANVSKTSEELRKGESTAEQGAMRIELHQAILDGMKVKFAENGFDFDKVLKKAKDLSTFATVDNTPQRVMEKALGYKEGGVLADLTVNKVAQNETEGIKWLNTFTDRKGGLLAQISKQYDIKPGSKKSAAAQMYAEGFYVDANNDIIQYGDAELAKDFPDVKVQNNIKALAKDPRIRQIYDDTLAQINASRARNAYPEIPKLDNYFLHFRAMEDTFSRLGLPFNPNDIKAKDLPTDLNGVTADLKPGQPYFASAMHRRGKRTSFDLLGGLEQYLTSAKNQIYHIDDIQTLRALRNYIADTYGQANGLEGLDTLSEEEAQERIKQVYGSHLSTFAKFLNEEANVIAGKTALIDRGLEGIIGRRGITFLDTVNRQVGANMVGFNVSSSLTNFVAAAQAFAKTNKFDFTKAFAQTVSNKIGSIFGKGDGFTENSPVAIRRKGADRFHRTPWQKVGDAGYALMGAVDNISTELIARTKYNELTRKGMDSEQAHIETDKWVSRLMGDRSLGQQPQLYNSKMLGLVTKFQLEVRNQLDSQFYDTIQEANVSTEDIQNGLARNAKKAAKIGSTFAQLAVVQHLFGKAFESVAGYNPSFDIIDAIIKAFGWDDEEDSEDTVLDNIEEGFLSLLGDLPYTSTFTGGRIPISSALPIEQFVTGKDQYGNEKSRLETLGEAAPYYFLPGGYGQAKKTWQGLSMFDEDLPIAGSYTDSGKLRFPVEDTLANRVQAGLFGQWASGNAKDYFDNERKPLADNQVQEFIDSDMSIQDYWDYREGLSGLSTLAEKADYINSLDLTDTQKNLLINNIAKREEDIDMSDYGNYSSFEEFDYAKKNPKKYSFLKENEISYAQYQSFDDEAKDAWTWAYENPEKFKMSKAVSKDVVSYRRYTKALYNIKADKDEDGKSISGSRKEKVVKYLNNLNIDYGAKIILFKSEYKSDDTYNEDIVEYLNSRDDISYWEMEAILKELGFKVSADGTITWD